MIFFPLSRFRLQRRLPPSRRVRIALRSTEQAEGGEWEVQLC